MGFVLALGLSSLSVCADAQPTAYEQALYNKARYLILSKLSDEDFVSYCVTMNIGGETLLRLHDDILVKQTEESLLIAQGFNSDHPQMVAVSSALKDLRAQFAVKISEARKGLEIESKIADETISALSQGQK
jgi:hypothetical protein